MGHVGGSLEKSTPSLAGEGAITDEASRRARPSVHIIIDLP
jgi:hypothetical protein